MNKAQGIQRTFKYPNKSKTVEPGIERQERLISLDPPPHLYPADSVIAMRLCSSHHVLLGLYICHLAAGNLPRLQRALRRNRTRTSSFPSAAVRDGQTLYQILDLFLRIFVPSCMQSYSRFTDRKSVV